MAIVTNAGRARIAELLMGLPVYLAIGTGNEGQPEEYGDTGLANEIGRKAAYRRLYVVDDDHGEIVLPNGRRYRASDTPTRKIYFQFQFDYGDGEGGAVCEIGLFTDTKIKESAAQSKTFFTPDDLEDAGTLLLLAHLENPDTFNPQKRGAYEFVYSI